MDYITKHNGIDFNAEKYDAHTLHPSYLGPHSSGWTVHGTYKYECEGFKWVNEFCAHHPHYGALWGDFENTVYATSEEAFQSFVENFPPEQWTYDDI